MIFTSFTYLYFLALIVLLYWSLRRRGTQNLMLLAASYLFYGYVHPWFCLLIATSTLIDYVSALMMERRPRRRKAWLLLSLAANLGMLGAFKYFHFFADNVQAVAESLGLHWHPMSFRIMLPVGISFFTFQSLSYTIDVYRGRMRPRTNLIDFALFVAFFPQLVAGPIERAARFLPQIESTRRWDPSRFAAAWPLLIRGYLKKLVVADNVAVYADQIYALESPSALLLAVGTLAFAVQIYADFSAYTDIARGSMRLLGMELVENFRNPYAAISPSDFWRRWHISFSTWIRDYLYIPLGGSRVTGTATFFGVLLVTMALSGLWHGAAWHFVLWGVYHAILLFAYHRAGLGGKWQPRRAATRVFSWCAMFGFTLVGWTLFRAPSMGWLLEALFAGPAEVGPDILPVSIAVGALVLLFTLPLPALGLVDRLLVRDTTLHRLLHGASYGAALYAIAMFTREQGRDFIYFQF